MPAKGDEERVRALKSRFPGLDLEAIDVAFAIRRAATTVERRLAKRLKSHDITPVELQVLISVLLADGGPVDLTTLGAEVRVPRQT